MRRDAGASASVWTMELSGSICVITGGAGGIGSALAHRFAAEGADGVIVADLDQKGAAETAAAVNAAGRDVAVGVGCDVARETDVAALVRHAETEFGSVDLFCANAGVAVGSDSATPDDVWRQAIDVNVMAHVYAARHLLPAWLDRGQGYFLSTASAAGLLTQIGSAPYAVTKHGAVAFAEWLSVTYGDRGIKVSCLCPMGVRTAMLGTGAEDDPMAAAAQSAVVGAGAVLEPDVVAEVVVEGLRAERFLILPHPEVGEFFSRKATDYDRWLSGMRRLQASILQG